MSNDIIKSEQHEIVTAEKINDYMNVFGIASSLTDNEKKQFIEIAVASQLNPFKREIYCIPYMTSVKQSDGSYKKERKLSILTGYETYLKRAERSGKLNGWNVEISGAGEARLAKIIIHRKDWQYPLIHEIPFHEYREDNKMWKEKPTTMLKKVAMAQGFRLAFPDEMNGVPYLAEELPDNMTIPQAEDNKPEPEKPDVTPDALKPNSKGEIELPQGDHAKTMQQLAKCKLEAHLQIYQKVRESHNWKPEELKEQDDFIAALRAQWKAEADAAANMQ